MGVNGALIGGSAGASARGMVVVAAVYRFTPFPAPAALKGPLAKVCCANGVRGTLLLAPEGINGTIAGSPEGIDAVMAHLRALPGCADLRARESSAAEMPFGRMKVRLKREIVTLGVAGLDPAREAGTRVDPAEWNALVSAPDVAVIDTRNDYEVAIGTFRGAVDPGIATFRDFPRWWAENAARFAKKRVAMFCTGGIRCEKATALLRADGVEVFHLNGGILRYLEEVPEARSLWDGSCFVFDERVSVGHGLEEGPHVLCRGCRRPVAPADMARPGWEQGVSCPACIGERSTADRARYRSRQRQRG